MIHGNIFGDRTTAIAIVVGILGIGLISAYTTKPTLKSAMKQEKAINLLVWKLLKDRKSGFPSADERTQRITGKAAICALLIGNYFTLAIMLMLIFGRELYDLQNVDAGYLLISTLLVSSLSFMVLSWVFSRKGD